MRYASAVLTRCNYTTTHTNSDTAHVKLHLPTHTRTHTHTKNCTRTRVGIHTQTQRQCTCSPAQLQAVQGKHQNRCDILAHTVQQRVHGAQKHAQEKDATQ